MRQWSKRLLAAVMAFSMVFQTWMMPAEAVEGSVDSITPLIHLSFDDAENPLQNTGSAQDAGITSQSVGTSAGAQYEEGLNGGRALRLDGSGSQNGSWVEISKELDSTEGLTFTATIRLNELQDWGRAFDFGDSESNYLFYAPTNNTHSISRAELLNGDRKATIDVPGGGCALGEWYHVALTLDSSAMTLYLNGEQVGQAQDPPVYQSARGYLGKSQYAVDNYFNGSIDDFRVYDQTLSPEQVLELSQTVDAVPEPIAKIDFEAAEEDGFFVGEGAAAKAVNSPAVERVTVGTKESNAVLLSNDAYLQLLDSRDAEAYTGLNGLEGVTVSFWENSQTPDGTASWSFFARGERSINAGTGGSDSEKRHYLGYISRNTTGRIEKQNGSNAGLDMSGFPSGWRHISLSYSSAGVTVYVNGEKKIAYASHSLLSELLGGKQDVYFGYAATWNEHANVYLDDLTIYPEALSDREARTVYEQTQSSVAQEDMLLHYDFQDSSVDGTTLSDVTGNGYDGTIHDAATEGGVISFDGTDDYLEMPSIDWSGYEGVTISIDMKPGQSAKDLFAYNFGRNDAAGLNDQQGYMFLNPSRPANDSKARFAITETNYAAETAILADKGMPQGVWGNCVVVLDGTQGKIYIDGEKVGEAELTLKPSDLGETSYNWIAKSPYAPDPYFKGEVSDFRIYTKALTEEEVSGLYTEISANRKVPTFTGEMILHYDFEDASLEGDQVKDLSENGLDATLHGNAVSEKGILHLDGADDYVEMPPIDWSYSDKVTISMDMKPEQGAADLFAYNFGHNAPAAWNAQGGYMFLNPYRAAEGVARFAITASNYQNETSVNATAPIPADTWGHCVVVIDGKNATIYIDGEKVGQETLSMQPSDLGETAFNWIGKSPYEGDPYFKGDISDFRVYQKAFQESEVQALYAEIQDAKSDAMKELNFQADLDSVFIPNPDDIRGNITLLSECKNGSTVEWTSDREDVIHTEETDVVSEVAKKYETYDKVPAGVVTRQDEDTVVHLTAVITSPDQSMTETKEFTVTVKAAVEPKTEEDYTGYVYAYFRGDADTTHYQQTYFALSRDGLNWKDLNGGEPVLTSSLGTGGLRDHFLIRSPEGDKFYLIATDLNVGVPGGSWNKYAQQGSKSIMVWESEDLVNWSDQRMVPIVKNNMGCAWAPEAMYDENTGEYVVYLSVDTTQISGVGSKKVIYYVKTRDFWQFTEPQIFIGDNTSDPTSYLDTTMLKAGDSYYRITKRENVSPTWVFMEKSDAILGDYTEVSSNIGSSTAKGERDFEGVEGPAIFKFNNEDKWCLMLDGYNGANSGVGWFPSTITDLDSGQFTRVREGFKMPSGPKHGVMVPITETEYQALSAKWDFDPDFEKGQDPAEDDIYGYVKAYSSGTNETDGSVHLAIREKDQEGWTALNSDAGIMFPTLNDSIGQHELYYTDISMVRTSDGRFAVIANTNKNNGKYYYHLSNDLVDWSESIVASADSVSGLIGSDEIPLTEEEYQAIKAKYDKVVNTGIEKIPDMTVRVGETAKLPQTVTATYSDGSTAQMEVQWDEDSYDVNQAKTYTVTGTVQQTRYSNPLIEERADPYIVLGEDGYYYFTASYPAYGSVNNGYDRVTLRRAKTIEDLKDAQEVTVWGPGRPDYSVHGRTPKHVWAPEMHFVDGQWYIYFASGYQSGEWNIRPQVLQCAKDADPMEPNSWTFLGQMQGNMYESMSLDMTYFEHNGKQYVVWAHIGTPQEGHSSLYIAELENPWTIKGDPALITHPDYGWERAGATKESGSGTWVNEGPTLLKHGGKLFLAYSAADTADTYCIGLLTADEDADLLDKASWKKNQYPLLCTADVPGEIGPGHNSFTVDENGNVIFVYHARPISHASQACGHYNSNGLYDPCRHARVKRVHWAADGTPILKMVYDDELKEEFRTVTMQLTVKGSKLPTLDESEEIRAEETFGSANGTEEQENPYTNAFDGVKETYFDGQAGAYAGIDAGEAYYLEGYRIIARDGYSSQLKGLVIQGSMDKDQWDTLDTIADPKDYPNATEGITDCSQPYRYYRVVDMDTGACNVAEIEFYGYGISATGDVDRNGAVTLSDALLALKIAVEKVEPTNYQSHMADMDAKGGVGTDDVLKILKMVNQ